MQHFIPLTPDPRLGINRTGEIRDFNWSIFEDKITVITRMFYNNPAGGFVSKPEPFNKPLVVDDRDMVNNLTGEVILEEEYKATTLEDGTNPTYPSVTPQYSFMMGLTIGKLKAMGMVINDSTKVSDILLALIDQNVTASALKGKFDS